MRLAPKLPPERIEAIRFLLLGCNMVLTYQQMSPLPIQNCAGISNKKQLEIMVARVIRRLRLLLSNCMEAAGKTEPWTELPRHGILFPNAWKGPKKLQSVNFQLGGRVNGMETDQTWLILLLKEGPKRLIWTFLMGVLRDVSARLASASWNAILDRQLCNCQTKPSKGENCFTEDYSPALLWSWELLIMSYMWI